MAITIKNINNSDGIFYKLCASTSGEEHTTTSAANGDTTITIKNTRTVNNQEVDRENDAKVRYLTTLNNNTFANSIVIEFKWNDTDAHQEVVLMVPDKVIDKIVWTNGTTEFNENSGWQDISSGGTVSVSITFNESGAVSSHSPATNLTLYGYYVSKLGYKWLGDGRVEDSENKVGSWNYPGKARHRATSTISPDYVWSNQKYYKDFTFTQPDEIPNYYIMIAYKGYMAGIGHILIIEPSNIFQDQHSYYNNGPVDWQERFRLRYTLYAVYDDGTSPGIKEDQKRANNERTNDNNKSDAYSYAMWVKFQNQEIDTYDLTWYRWNGSAEATTDAYILLDSGKRPLQLSIAEGVKIEPPNVWGYTHQRKGSETIIFNKDTESFSGYWYRRNGNSGSNWGTTRLSNDTVKQITMGTQALSFAAIVEPKQRNITYNKHNNNSDPTEVTYTLPHGTNLTINPYGNLGEIGGSQAEHIRPDNGAQFVATASRSSYSVTVTKDMKIKDPTADGYKFIGWDKSDDGKTLTAVWEPDTVKIIYEPNGGGGTSKEYNVVYNERHQIKTIDEVNFTAPAGKKLVYWNTSRDGSDAKKYYPGKYIIMTKNITLYAIWGSPWRKVKWIWVYEPDRPDGPNDDSGWKRHKVWVNIK